MKIDELELLRIFSKNVYITKTIQEEFGDQIPNWIVIKNPFEDPYQKVLSTDLDEGEASAIGLSLATENALLILDDLKARKFAGKLGLHFSGTLGLILKLKQIGIVDSVTPIIQKIRNTNFRISEELLEQVIKDAGE
jgi:predicted nucleic acid-binding protein